MDTFTVAAKIVEVIKKPVTKVEVEVCYRVPVTTAPPFRPLP